MPSIQDHRDEEIESFNEQTEKSIKMSNSGEAVCIIGNFSARVGTKFEKVAGVSELGDKINLKIS